ncbi:hypothetical protein J8273_0226 [Carpediemonas membranifera]|uniref:Uncharacterized protein n=1 Tax=Carpediemonas membranifera TaxID=201153 RepID=A0A8J6B614_9EUKA|nr:hypothetical protein J8273_0226 [Carpediemonas membranifera]|eukprot:KAG9395014.1 hypothetical protein J8273_0226 [Carpediemonas membranifera]
MLINGLTAILAPFKVISGLMGGLGVAGEKVNLGAALLTLLGLIILFLTQKSTESSHHRTTFLLAVPMALFVLDGVVRFFLTGITAIVHLGLTAGITAFVSLVSPSSVQGGGAVTTPMLVYVLLQALFALAIFIAAFITTTGLALSSGTASVAMGRKGGIERNTVVAVVVGSALTGLAVATLTALLAALPFVGQVCDAILLSVAVALAINGVVAAVRNHARAEESDVARLVGLAAVAAPSLAVVAVIVAAAVSVCQLLLIAAEIVVGGESATVVLLNMATIRPYLLIMAGFELIKLSVTISTVLSAVRLFLVGSISEAEPTAIYAAE